MGSYQVLGFFLNNRGCKVHKLICYFGHVTVPAGSENSHSQASQRCRRLPSSARALFPPGAAQIHSQWRVFALTQDHSSMPVSPSLLIPFSTVREELPFMKPCQLCVFTGWTDPCQGVKACVKEESHTDDLSLSSSLFSPP